jgi:hypothetical protein
MALSSLSTPLLEKAFAVLQRANELEDECNFDDAHRGYQDAINLLKRQVQRMESQREGRQNQAVSSEWHTTKQLIHDKIRHYEKHSEQLWGKISSSNKVAKATEGAEAAGVKVNNRNLGTTHCRWEQLQQAEAAQAAKSNAYLSLALQFDETGEKAAAIENYLAAAEALLPVIKSLAQPAGEQKVNDSSSSTTTNRSYKSAISSSLTRKMHTIMDRVEELKKLGGSSPYQRSISYSPPRTNRTVQPNEQRETEQHYYPSTKLTTEEIEVLKRSSLISSGVFLPWVDDEIHTFDFTNKGKLWSDPDGLLELSPTQKETFYAWKRPTDIVAMQNSSYSRKTKDIKMIQCITPYTICQKAITDCSFIARYAVTHIFFSFC